MLQAIDHVNIVVADLEKSARFYEDVLGFSRTKQVVIRGDWVSATVGLPNAAAECIYLDLPAGGTRIELLRYLEPTGVRPADMGVPNVHGIRHIAFLVKDIDALTARLKQAGVRVFSDVQQVPDSQVTYAGGVKKHLVYFHDPEGNLLEFCEYK
jgi:catechol 2,3-dioxygenase-like lactoylglutathione lyase family enzyme